VMTTTKVAAVVERILAQLDDELCVRLGLGRLVAVRSMPLR
jgi:hypothetical protein